MDKVVVTKSKLDSLAQHINAKAGTTGAKTIDQMQTTVDGISGGGAKETWVLNENCAIDALPLTGAFQISFTSNGTSYESLSASNFKYIVFYLYYGETLVCTQETSSSTWTWESQAYRKLTFDTPPTGDLLTWLQANGVKQPDDTAIQDTKALTITSNGTVSVTPDAPYDALKKVDVTVDVASGGGTETTSVEVYGDSSTIDMPIFCTWQTENGWLGTSEFELTGSNGDFLFTIPDVLVGGYIVFTKDPMNQALFYAMKTTGVEWITVEPKPGSGDVSNASCVVKVVEPGANFSLYIASA